MMSNEYPLDYRISFGDMLTSEMVGRGVSIDKLEKESG